MQHPSELAQIDRRRALVVDCQPHDATGLATRMRVHIHALHRAARRANLERGHILTDADRVVSQARMPTGLVVDRRGLDEVSVVERVCQRVILILVRRVAQVGRPARVAAAHRRSRI